MVVATEAQANQIRANVDRVRAEIAAACARAGREPADVTLIGVTKSVDRPTADALIAAGVREIGENRVQDAVAKFGRRSPFPPLAADVKLHMIGNLQTNKVRDVVGLFASIQSLNRIGLAEALHREATRREVVQDILIEVNTAEDEAKLGVSTESVSELLGYVASECPSLRIRGLMTIAQNAPDLEDARPAFRVLRELRDALRSSHPSLALDVLSMGMSNDFPIAIEEGATHVRIGRALFAGLPSPV
jgi:pyridoxal phosphate enzyme (YggS family)